MIDEKYSIQNYIKDLSEEDQEEVISFIIDDFYKEENHISQVKMGCINKESVADEYFGNEEECYAVLFKNGRTDKYVICIKDINDTDFYIFDDFNEAESEIQKLEYELYHTIDRQISIFVIELKEELILNELDEKIDKIKDLNIEPIRKYNSNNFYSFNIYLEDNLIVEDVSDLDYKTIKEVVKFIDNN